MTILSPEPERPSDAMPWAARWLGGAGLIPFILSAALAYTAPDAVDRLRAADAGMFYGAVILSFLGGIRWGLALGPQFARDRNLQIAISVVPSLVGWAALLVAPVIGALMLIAGFVGMLLLDALLGREGRAPDWFFGLRLILTTGAVLSLIALLISFVI